MGKPNGNSPGPNSPGLQNLAHLRTHLSHMLTLLKGCKHTQQLILKSHYWKHFCTLGMSINCLVTREQGKGNGTYTKPGIFFKLLPFISDPSKSPYHSLSKQYGPSEAELFGNLWILANFYDWNTSPWHHWYDTVVLLSNLKELVITLSQISRAILIKSTSISGFQISENEVHLPIVPVFYNN